MPNARQRRGSKARADQMARIDEQARMAGDQKLQRDLLETVSRSEFAGFLFSKLRQGWNIQLALVDVLDGGGAPVIDPLTGLPLQQVRVRTEALTRVDLIEGRAVRMLDKPRVDPLTGPVLDPDTGLQVQDLLVHSSALLFDDLIEGNAIDIWEEAVLDGGGAPVLDPETGDPRMAVRIRSDALMFSDLVAGTNMAISEEAVLDGGGAPVIDPETGGPRMAVRFDGLATGMVPEDVIAGSGIIMQYPGDGTVVVNSDGYHGVIDLATAATITVTYGIITGVT